MDYLMTDFVDELKLWHKDVVHQRWHAENVDDSGFLDQKATKLTEVIRLFDPDFCVAE